MINRRSDADLAMPNVIHVMHMLSELDSIGGITRVLLYLLRNSDCSVIRHSFVCMSRGALQSEFERHGALVRVIDSSASPIIFQRALSIAREIKPDVIATHHFTRALLAGAAVARIMGVPLVHNEHTPASVHFDSRSAVAWISALLRRRALHSAKNVICNSNFTARVVADTYGIHNSLLKVIHLPVERRVLDIPDIAAKSNNTAGVLWLGHVGGMIGGKVNWRDQGTLLRALRLLRDQGVDARLILIGDGSARAGLELLAMELGLRQWVSFEGYKTDLAAFFARIDVYINPAFAEAFGVAVVEAMLEGKPVVIANAGAHPELIEDGISGLLHQPRDAESLAAQLLRLANDTSLQISLARAGKERALQCFAAPRYAQCYQREMLSTLATASHRVASAINA